MLVVHLFEQLAFEFPADLFGVHEVAVAATIASPFIVLSALGLSEVRDRRILTEDDFSRIIPTIESFVSALCLILGNELGIDITDHMITDVVGYHDLFDLTELG
jgi:hypothetical protein